MYWIILLTCLLSYTYAAWDGRDEAQFKKFMENTDNKLMDIVTVMKVGLQYDADRNRNSVKIKDVLTELSAALQEIESSIRTVDFSISSYKDLMNRASTCPKVPTLSDESITTIGSNIVEAIYNNSFVSSDIEMIVTRIIDTLENHQSKGGRRVKRGLTDWISNAVGSVLSTIVSPLIAGIRNIVAEVINQMLKIFSNLFEDFVLYLIKFIERIHAQLEELFEVLFKLVLKLLEILLKLVLDIVGKLPFDYIELFLIYIFIYTITTKLLLSLIFTTIAFVIKNTIT